MIMKAWRSNLQVLTLANVRNCAADGGIDHNEGVPLIESMTTRDRIAEKLAEAFTPAHLDVADESHKHAGHAGARPGGETHFRVHIVSAAFSGKSRIERHRMVNETLSEELKGGVHALAIHASAPGETAA